MIININALDRACKYCLLQLTLRRILKTPFGTSLAITILALASSICIITMIVMDNTTVVSSGTSTATIIYLPPLTILLLAAFNINILLMVRNSEQLEEIALLNALGASRWVITNKLLSESVIIYFLGSVIGLLVTGVCLDLLTDNMSVLGLKLAQDDSVLQLNHTAYLWFISVNTALWLFTALLLCLYSYRLPITTTLNHINRVSSSTIHNCSEFLITVQITVSSFLVSAISKMLRHELALFSTLIFVAILCLSIVLVFFSAYSLCARKINTQRQEIGIRRALGAPAHTLKWYITARYGKLIVFSCIYGLSLSTLLAISIAPSSEFWYASAELWYITALEGLMINGALIALSWLACIKPLNAILISEPAKDLYSY